MTYEIIEGQDIDDALEITTLKGGTVLISQGPDVVVIGAYQLRKLLSVLANDSNVNKGD